MKVAIYTLGCKVNQYETQVMEQELRRRGHEVVAFSAPADAYVVNSCSVTAVSDQKSRQMLHRIRREFLCRTVEIEKFPLTGIAGGQRQRDRNINMRVKSLGIPQIYLCS